jgi:hypothetical protein
VNATTLFDALSYINGSVWACGTGTAGVSGGAASCTLADARTGELSTEYKFPWDTITSAIVANDQSRVMVSGRSTVAGVVSSEIAECTISASALSCTVKSFQSVNFLTGSYNAYSQKVVYIGTNTDRAAGTLIDVHNGTTTNRIYTTPAMNSIVLAHVQSPPNFVGSFIAGTSVGSTAAAVKYIFAGWLRTDTGQMAAAIGITPASDSILSTTDLVNAMVLEATGPDSFIAGGLQLSDGAGMHAYLVRANTLYKNVQYCVRFLSNPTSNRRMLSATSMASIKSAVRGLALTDVGLFVILDVRQSAARNNQTSLSVLKIRTATGAIIKQAQVSAPNGENLFCTDITTAGILLTIACTVQSDTSALRSILITVDRELSFLQLPVGFLKHGNDTFQAEGVPVKATVLTISSPLTTVTVTASEVSTFNQAPSRRPSAVPSVYPSSDPSSLPSAQPSSSPTFAPSVSPQPSSRPSTSGPTNTHKPTVISTPRPSVRPTVAITVRPSKHPTSRPTAQPTRPPSTIHPTRQPTAAPTVQETPGPSTTPTRAHTRRPSAVRTDTPTLSSTGAEGSSSGSTWTDDQSSYVIGASAGGAVCFGLCGLYVLYRRRARKQKEKSTVKVNQIATADLSTRLSDTPPVQPPPATPVVSAAAEWGVREPARYNFNTPIETRSRCVCYVSASSISNLHLPVSGVRSRGVSFTSDASPDNTPQGGGRSRGVSFASDTSFTNEARSRFVSYASISSMSTLYEAGVRSHGASMVSTASYNISSLHTSERSFDGIEEYEVNISDMNDINTDTDHFINSQDVNSVYSTVSRHGGSDGSVSSASESSVTYSSGSSASNSEHHVSYDDINIINPD